jgi:hypothetical protein
MSNERDAFTLEALVVVMYRKRESSANPFEASGTDGQGWVVKMKNDDDDDETQEDEKLDKTSLVEPRICQFANLPICRFPECLSQSF